MLTKTFTYDGKRYFIRGKDEMEVALKMVRKKRELEEGTIVINKNTTVERWIDEWLKTYIKPNVGEATYYAYERRVEVHIKPVIGKLKLCDVRPIHLQKIMNNATGTKDHLKKIRYTIINIFDKAQKNKLIIVNPAEDLTIPKSKNNTRRSITDHERKYLLKVAETHSSGLWIKVMLYCGLRPQETAGLQGRHIDLKNGNIKVEQALKRHGNVIGETKSDSGERLVPIPDILLKDLKKAKVQPYEYVFKNMNGSHMTQGGMRTRWRSFKRAMNIAMGCKTFKNAVVPPYRVAEDLVPYCLRHTFCTDLQDAGVPINVAKELMGHSDISITAKIYTHKTDTSYNNAKDLIQDYQKKVTQKVTLDSSK